MAALSIRRLAGGNSVKALWLRLKQAEILGGVAGWQVIRRGYTLANAPAHFLPSLAEMNIFGDAPARLRR